MQPDPRPRPGLYSTTYAPANLLNRAKLGLCADPAQCLRARNGIPAARGAPAGCAQAQVVTLVIHMRTPQRHPLRAQRQGSARALLLRGLSREDSRAPQGRSQVRLRHDTPRYPQHAFQMTRLREFRYRGHVHWSLGRSLALPGVVLGLDRRQEDLLGMTKVDVMLQGSTSRPSREQQ
jgi:hypothetical protein